MTALLDTAKRHLNIVGTDDDVALAQYINAAVEFVQRYSREDRLISMTGAITFGPTPPSPGDKITLNGIEFAATDTDPAGVQEFLIGATLEQTAQNFADAWNDYLYSLTELPGWIPGASANGRVVTLIAGDAAPPSSPFTMSTTSAAVTLSGETLSDVAISAPAVLQAVLMLVGHLYANREASLVGVHAEEVPLGVWTLLAPYREWSF
jgi:hypothetical protein